MLYVSDTVSGALIGLNCPEQPPSSREQWLQGYLSLMCTFKLHCNLSSTVFSPVSCCPWEDSLEGPWTSSSVTHMPRAVGGLCYQHPSSCAIPRHSVTALASAGMACAGVTAAPACTSSWDSLSLLTSWPTFSHCHFTCWGLWPLSRKTWKIVKLQRPLIVLYVPVSRWGVLQGLS